MTKPYTRLALTKAEFSDVRGSINTSRGIVFERFMSTSAELHPQECEFYRARLAVYDALLAKFDAVLVADRSQDAEPDDDEDEDEDEDD